MLNFIKSLLISTNKMVLSMYAFVMKLENNIYYIKLTKMFSVFHNLFSNIISVFMNIFSDTAIYLKSIYKILKIGVIFIFIYRLVIILFGYDYILAHHPIELDLLTDFVNNIYSEMTLYKNQYLQWLINQLNSFISSDINSNISPTTDQIISPTIESPIIESNINQPSLRADYKDTIVSTDSHNAFYHSPYFYIPAATIAIISISMLGFYYYQEGIFNLWLSFHDLGVNNQGHIYTPDYNLFKTVVDSNDVMEYVGNIDYVDNTSSVEYSHYFKSPEKLLIDLASREGSPTPKASELSLPYIFSI
jgi:hypothetical protein